MTPAADSAFAARCRAVCPRFRAIGALRARKSALLVGDVDGQPVVAKQLARPNQVWAWYLAHEIAVYRAFAAVPPPFRVPTLVAASDDILVIERIAGEPAATRRRSAAMLDPAIL